MGSVVVGWLLAAKHVLSPMDESALVAGLLGRILIDALTVWVVYLALEPFVRRRTPWRIIGWNRLLAGGWRDPLVGREVLVGLAAGAAFVVGTFLIRIMPEWFGGVPAHRSVWDTVFTEGIADLFFLQQYALQTALVDFFLFFVVLLACRRERLAVALVMAIWIAPWALGQDWLQVILRGMYHALGLLILLRFGLLSYVVYAFTRMVLPNMPVTLDYSAWYAGTGTLCLLILAGLAFYGFWISRAGQPLFKTNWLDA
jgi:serine/threonine-protein kinase